MSFVVYFIFDIVFIVCFIILILRTYMQYTLYSTI